MPGACTPGPPTASTALAGEFIGILSGPDPEAVRSGLEAAVCFIRNDAAFVKANDQGTVVYFAHCIARSGSYLSAQAEGAGGNGPGLPDRPAPGGGHPPWTRR